MCEPCPWKCWTREIDEQTIRNRHRASSGIGVELAATCPQEGFVTGRSVTAVSDPSSLASSCQRCLFW
jgi:hypothetical protein